MARNIIKYTGITLDEAMEMVEEILPHYSGSDVENSEGMITITVREFSNLFEQSEVYQVMMNGGSYEEAYEYADIAYLEATVNIVFDSGEIIVDSWHDLRHYGVGFDSMTFDVDCEYQMEIVEEIRKLKNFE